MSSFRAPFSPGSGTALSIATLAGDLWKWAVVLRVRRKSLLAAGFRLPCLEDAAAPDRESCAVDICPVAPSADLTARWMACAAQGIHRGHSCLRAFLTLLPESVVEELTSCGRTPKRDSCCSSQVLMFSWSWRPAKGVTPRLMLKH